MHRPRQRSLGFTLLELLIALGILGILISAIIAMTSGFLGYTRHVSVTNDRLIELNDVAGYVATNGRRAMQFIGGSTTVDISIGGTTFTCSTNATDGPCVAMVVPIVDREAAGADIIGFDLLAYRVVPLSDWDDDPGLPQGWNGPDTPLMLEYRAELCSSCSVPPVVPNDVAADQVSLVLPNLFLEDNAGDAVAPFAIEGGSAESALRLGLRTRGSGQQDVTIVPADEPLILTATKRP